MFPVRIDYASIDVNIPVSHEQTFSEIEGTLPG
jgi:hypothetical protein